MATATQSLRGMEDSEDEHEADFLFSMQTSGHQVSRLLGYAEMTLPDSIILLVVCVFKV